jgi:hypothetical protein
LGGTPCSNPLGEAHQGSRARDRTPRQRAALREPHLGRLHVAPEKPRRRGSEGGRGAAGREAASGLRRAAAGSTTTVPRPTAAPCHEDGAAVPTAWTGHLATWTEREGEGGGGIGRWENGKGRGDGLGLGAVVFYTGERKGWVSGLCWAGGGLGQSFAESPPSSLLAKRQFS